MTALVARRWPSGLPQYVERSSYREKPKRRLISFQPEDGPPIDMPKSDYRSREISCTMIMKSDQVDLLDEFIDEELKGNSLTFLGPHPRTRAWVEMKLIGDEDAPYEMAVRNGREFNVSMTLLVLGE